ncbi:13429_t:CDS:2 [Entrophospora sp. SA101]|nr:13429_t:CDS:2 [Entrophospora sp. SA101]
MENHENSGRLQNGLENVSNNDVDSDMNLDQSEDKDWTVVKRKERFIVQIEAENVPGGNNNAKLASASKVLSNIQPLVGLNIKYIKGIKYIVATFGTKENADKACELPFAENNSPLTAKKEVLMNILSSYGEITNIKMRAQGTWYKAQITFKDKESMSKFGDKWSIMYLKDSCRIAPLDVTKEEIDERNSSVKAKTCFITRTRQQYTRKRFAYITFENDEDMKNACLTNFAFRNNNLSWESDEHKTCHKCGNSDHFIAVCPEKEKGLYHKYRVPQPKSNSQKAQQRIIEPNNSIKRNIVEIMKNIQKDLKKIMLDIEEVKKRVEALEINAGTNLSNTSTQHKTTENKFQNNSSKVNSQKGNNKLDISILSRGKNIENIPSTSKHTQKRKKLNESSDESQIDGNLLKISNHNVMGMKDPVKQKQIINTIETLQLDV